MLAPLKHLLYDSIEMRTSLTFLTDFGWGSPYPAAMKAVVSGIADLKLIDITHDIPPQDIREGAFALWSVVPYFVAGTIHCAVVDPGVGTDRSGLILRAGGHYFVGPDNGLLSAAAAKLGDVKAYKITDSKYIATSVSATFHGRDIFAPIAAHIGNGVEIRDLASPIDKWKRLKVDFESGAFDEEQETWIGEIISIDHFGNFITNISGQLISDFIEYGETLEIKSTSFTAISAYQKSYGYVAQGEPLLLINSVGLLEFARNSPSSRMGLELNVGDEVRLCRHG